MKKIIPFLLLVSGYLLATEAPVISVDELDAKVKAKEVFVIDANSEQMYKEGHVPGAISNKLKDEEFAKKLPAEKNTLIVAYCGGPMCTAWEAAAERVGKLGYNNVQHLKAGISGWKKAKKPVEKM